MSADGDRQLTTAWLAANSVLSALAAGKLQLVADDVAGVLAVIDYLTR